MSDDLISRQAAIEAILKVLGLRNPNWFPNQTEREVFEAIKQLPPAQPERIIHCKDCEWWTKQEASPQGRCALMGMYPTGEWYCGNARREVTE